MTGPWTNAATWFLQTAMGGGLLLLLVLVLMSGTQQPARRQRLGECGAVAALVLALLALGPSWLNFSVPVPAQTRSQAESIPMAETAPVTESREPTPAIPVPSSADALFLFPEESPPVLEPDPVPVEPERAPLWEARSTTRELSPLKWAFRAVPIAYALVALFLLIRCLVGYWVLARMLRKADPAEGAVADLFAGLAADIRPAPRLLISRSAPVPFSCGLFRPTVVMPVSWCEQETASALRWVFAHELVHLRRRDAWSGLLFELAGAVYFYLPWFWWLRRQTRLCQEYVADAAAAQPTSSEEDYAQFLLNLAKAPALPLAATGVLDNSSDLFRRVSMLLKAPIRVESHCPKSWLLASSGGLLVLAIFAAGIGVQAETPALPGQVAVAADEPVKAPAKTEPTPPKKGDPSDKPALDAEQLRKDAVKRAEKIRIEALERAEKIRKEAHQRIEDLRIQVSDSIRGVPGTPAVVWPGEGRLGIRIEPPGNVLADQLDLPKGKGQVVVQVLPNSVAAKAGLRKHDVLLEVDGKAVPNDYFQFLKQLEAIKGKFPMDIVVLRKGKKETVKGVTLPEGRPAIPFGVQPPMPVVPPAIPTSPFGRTLVAPGSVMTTITRTADRFTTRYQEGNLVITLTGAVADGKAKVGAIKVQDAAVATKYADLEKVPDQYRDKVKNLIETTEKGNLRIESKQ